jgi:putative ABC transport system permease protein
MLIFVGAIVGLVVFALLALAPLFLLLLGGEAFLSRWHVGRASRFLLLLLKSLRRNPLRTSLTYLAVFVLVSVVTIVWSAMYVLNHLMQEKANDIKMVISEKWQAGGTGAMPFGYAGPLSEGAYDPSRARMARPEDAMTWQFYIGTLDPEKKTRENLVFLIALDPWKAATLMDRIYDDVPTNSKQKSGPKLARVEQFMAAISAMQNNKRGVILGRKILATLNKRVGDRMKLTGLNYKDIDLEVEIVGSFPAGRFDDQAIMNRDYLNDAVDTYPKTHRGEKHPLADRSLNLVVLQVSDQEIYNQVTGQIDSSGLFQSPAVKCETLAAYAVTQLEGYRDIIWGMQWLLSPAILVTMALVIANGISISVRERRKEIAVLKVLGYRPVQVLMIILGEAMLIGALGGLLSTALVHQTVNRLMDNNNSILPVFIPDSALWWGPAVGVLTGLVGSLVPAWSACRVQVSTVFARVA